MWNEDIETLSRSEIEELQLKKLQKTVKQVYDNVPFYHDRLESVEVYPETIETLKDIERIPFTTKEDLRSCYPYGLLSISMDDVVELHSSSGTTGKPVVSAYTQKDLKVWSEIMARGLTSMGFHKGDILQNTHGYGMFTGGFGVHYGAEYMGISVIPISTGQTKRQIEIMKDFEVTGLVFTPSYGLHIAEVCKNEGINPKDFKIHTIGFGAELWTEEMRQRIQEEFDANACNIYGLTEIMGPGVGMECNKQNGLHIAEDYILPEIINPNTGETQNPGSEGELVLTNLEREGMPILRFRTRDITTLHNEKCECGRTFLRMERVKGRYDDMIKVKGVSIFPSQVEKALLKVNQVDPHYMIIVTRPDGILDEMEIKVEASNEIFSDNVKEMINIQKKIGDYVQNEIGIKAKITLVEPNTLPRFEGKAKRVIDERKF